SIVLDHVTALVYNLSFDLLTYDLISPTVVIFFFSSRRRHTRSLRDWSSDVCSSDLRKRASLRVSDTTQVRSELAVRAHVLDALRSEERRVGKECRYRRVQDLEKKKTDIEVHVVLRYDHPPIGDLQVARAAEAIAA